MWYLNDLNDFDGCFKFSKAHTYADDTNTTISGKAKGHAGPAGQD